MKRLLLWSVLCLPLAAPPAWGRAEPPPAPTRKTEAPIVTLPAKVTAKANRYFFLRAGGNCAAVKWIIPEGLERLDPEVPLKDANAVALIGDAGTYTVQAYGALGDVASDVASCVVTIGTPPPGPGPTPPGPVDPFTASVQAAYAGEAATTKAADAAAWAAVFRAAVGHLDTANPPIVTAADLMSDLKTALAATRPGALPKVKAALAAEMQAAWGTAPTATLDKAAAKAELGRIAAALGGLQ